MTDVPLVTVLIPARNEAADIGRCLGAVLAQDHPHDRMEIILVDGGSTDSTGEVATRVLEQGDIDWKIIDNPTGTTPSNLNAGLAVASGEYLCRVDARSIIPHDYVRMCAGVLRARDDVGVTGGAQVAASQHDSLVARGIARALNNRYAMGGSSYRSDGDSGPTDTVYLGAFRTKQLRAVGGWDEAMHSNQDFELNRRIGRELLVWYDSRLRVGYVPRDSFGALARQYFRFGRWKVRYWRRSGDRPLPRQMAVLMACPGASLGVALAVMRSRRRARVAALVALAGGVGLVAVDTLGVGTDDRAVVRCTAALATAVVGASWVVGIGVEAVRPGDHFSAPT